MRRAADRLCGLPTENPKDSFLSLEIAHVLEAVEKAGMLPTGHCLTLNSLENRVYDLKLEDGSHAVVKFYRPGRWTRDQIFEEHEFLFDLEKAEIPVCVPIPLKSGGTIGLDRGLFFAVWPRTGGRSPDELTVEDAEILGRFLARLHNTGSTKKASHRIVLNTEKYIEEPLRFLKDGNFLPARLEERFASAARKAAEYYEQMSASVPFHRIHGDCHKGNLLRGEGGFFFLDFDDFLTGPAVQDVWMLVPERDENGDHLKAALIEGYLQFREFDLSWLRLTEALRAMRYVYYSAWIARRWHDPIFHSAFPHFGSDDYWEKETRDLEDQALILERGGEIREENEEETEELTNKDFFWDM